MMFKKVHEMLLIYIAFADADNVSVNVHKIKINKKKQLSLKYCQNVLTSHIVYSIFNTFQALLCIIAIFDQFKHFTIYNKC